MSFRLQGQSKRSELPSASRMAKLCGGHKITGERGQWRVARERDDVRRCKGSGLLITSAIASGYGQRKERGERGGQRQAGQHLATLSTKVRSELLDERHRRSFSLSRAFSLADLHLLLLLTALRALFLFCFPRVLVSLAPPFFLRIVPCAGLAQLPRIGLSCSIRSFVDRKPLRGAPCQSRL